MKKRKPKIPTFKPRPGMSKPSLLRMFKEFVQALKECKTELNKTDLLIEAKKLLTNALAELVAQPRKYGETGIELRYGRAGKVPVVQVWRHSSKNNRRLFAKLLHELKATADAPQLDLVSPYVASIMPRPGQGLRTLRIQVDFVIASFLAFDCE